MTATLVPDFSISINQRRWACVLDPVLALSEYGLPLVKQLGELMELWIVREFWHILDNTEFYLQQPEFILGQSVTTLPSAQKQNLMQTVMRSLKEWERLRLNGDRHSWNIHFLADVLGESCVPPGIDSDLIWRWESLAHGLDIHLDEQPSKTDSLTLAFRDLTALAAARPACILTYRPSLSQQLPPLICKTLEQWQIPCQEIQSSDGVADIEREQFRNLLVHAGLSKYLWAGLNLSVLHIVAPAAATLSTIDDPEWADEYPFSAMNELTIDRRTPVDLWQGAQVFWYTI
jgi:hypothetical protein